MAAYADMRPTQGQGHECGLVLLYAPSFQQLQPAYPLFSEQAIIGREPPAEVLIPQPAVSRSHARLTLDQHGWTITDLGARNGTLVDGAFVRQQRLRHLSEVRVGDAFFKFVEQACAAYLPYRIDGAVMNAPATPTGLVGGYQMAAIASALQRISLSPISIVVLGESGTGKEVFARQIHDWSGRSGAFCALNCAAIPPTLLESELFGYRRGAFSGADRDHVGLVRAADQGTLFLDEVGDMPLEAQAKLLRVLQTKEVLPLGATRPEQVDVRVVCATHRDLGAMQQSGKFRRDLFARLNEYSVTLPPLRHRKEDIYALCLEFLRQQKRPDMVLSVPYITGLLHYDFPYNVRELEALIKRGIALADSPTLKAEHLSAEIQAKMEHYGRQLPRVAAMRPTSPSHNPWQQAGSYDAASTLPSASHGFPPDGYPPSPHEATQPHGGAWPPPSSTPAQPAGPHAERRRPTVDPAVYEMPPTTSAAAYPHAPVGSAAPAHPSQAHPAQPHPAPAHPAPAHPAQAHPSHHHPGPHAAQPHAAQHHPRARPGQPHPAAHHPGHAAQPPPAAPYSPYPSPASGISAATPQPATRPSVQAYNPEPSNQPPSEPELRAALQAHRGNVAAVGRQFGKERMQVHRWMRRYAIDPNDYRDKPR